MHFLAGFLETIVQLVIVTGLSHINAVINVDHIPWGKISSPSKIGIVSNLRYKALNVWMVIEWVLKTFAVAPEAATFYHIHVYRMSHVVVATFRRFYDGSF